MPNKKAALVTPAGLRRRAERRAATQPATHTLPQTQAEAQRMLHELEVHQIELEMQNGELRAARDDAELLLDKYTDLYDFAPVAYFTLAADGTIRMVNLTGSRLVGIERARLVGRSFGLLVPAARRPAFHAFLGQVFAGGIRQAMDSELLCKSQSARAVNIAAERSPNGQECSVVVMDISERLRALDATTRLAAIVLTTDAAVYTKDLAGVITSWNPGAERMYGYRAEEIVGHNIARLIPPARAGEGEALVEKLSRGEPVANFETERLRKDGSLVCVSLSSALLRDAAGHGHGVSIIARDITAGKRHEESLRLSELRYRRLFETAHDGVLVLDPATCKITDANPFMTELLSYSREQLIGKELFEIGLLKDGVASREMFQNLNRNHEVRYEDLPLEGRGGRHQEVEVVANLYQEDGHAVIQCNVRDITDRKHTEEMLRRNEALFAVLIEQAPVGICVVDAKFRLLQVNTVAMPAFNHIVPLIGRDFSEIHHLLWEKRSSDQVVKRFRHTLKTGEPYQAPEVAQRRLDTGVKEIFEWQVQRITLPAGEYGVVAFFNNITERKRAETAQRRLAVLTASNLKLHDEIVRRQAVEVALQHSEQLQGQLLKQSQLQQQRLRQLSHQMLHAQEQERKRISRELHDVIAQTLVGINVHVAALTEGCAGNPKSFQRKIARMHQVVEASLDTVHRFARQLRPTMLDDLGLIPALQTFMKSFMEDTGVRVSLKAFAGIEHATDAVRTVLYRVAHEALTNVARHAKASRVDVNIQHLDGGIQMEIRDNGQGFNVEAQSRSKRHQRLGLLGMRERVEMIDGTFCIESSPGHPTTVRVDLPAEMPGTTKAPRVR